MDTQLTFTFPWWYTLLCLAAGLAFATFLYFGKKFDHKYGKTAKWLMFTWRTLIVTIICFLLLSPLLRHISYEEIKPDVIIGVDQSQSVGFALGNSKEEVANQLMALRDALSEAYNVSMFGIGHQMSAEVNAGFNEPHTNLNQFFQFINDSRQTSATGAVILLSDGIFNQGPSPLFEASRIKAPIYTIAVGDSTPAADLTLKNIIHNEIGFQGDISKLQVDIQAFNLQGRSATVTLSHYDRGVWQSIQTKTIRIGDGNYFETIDFQALLSKSGNQRYMISVSRLPGESTYGNNQKEFYIDVLDSKLQIDIVAAAPHPDLSALRHVIDENKNYSLRLHYLNQPVSIQDKTDLIILYQVPTTNQFASTFEPFWNKIKDSKTPILFILGGQSNLTKFNQIQEILSVRGNQGSINDVYGLLDPNFAIFAIKDHWQSAMSHFPPLQVPFGEFVAGPGTSILLHQKIGRVDTKYPLWLTGVNNGRKIGVIAGEGLWRWRLNEYNRTNKTDVFNDITGNTIRFLATREDKRKFKVRTDATNYSEADNIIFAGELYNNNYELVNTPEVHLSVKDQSNKEYKYTLTRNGQAYQLDIGQMTPGNYSYTAITRYLGNDLTSSGHFTVSEVSVELFDLVADYGMLNRLAEVSGGVLVGKDRIAELAQMIKSNDKIKPIITSNKKTDPLINLKWIFGILVGLLALEWFTRRYLGKY